MAFDRLENAPLRLKGENAPRDLHIWMPGEPPRACVLMVHGMGEHIGRYDRTARDLCERGILAAGADLRGHGPDCPSGRLGFFAESGGWETLLDDVAGEAAVLRERYPDRPLILLGHSMGSFIAREYAVRHGASLSGLILSGTGNYTKSALVSGLMLTRLYPKGRPAPLVDSIAFSGNNRPFKPARTAYDWLTRDESAVDRYAADPLCGFTFTSGAFRDFFGGILKLTDTKRLDGMPKDLPVLFVSGAMDPVGQMGRGVEKTAADFRARGMTRVTVRLYPGARHEVFNETCRDEVLDDVCRFIGGIAG